MNSHNHDDRSHQGTGRPGLDGVKPKSNQRQSRSTQTEPSQSNGGPLKSQPTQPTKPNPSQLQYDSARPRSDFNGLDLAVPASKVKRRHSWWQKALGWFSPKRATGVAAALVLVVIGAAAWWMVSLSDQVIVKNNNQSALALEGEVDPTRLKGEGDGRINVLLIGTGGEQHKAGDLADSIMLVSIDPFAKEAAMLSIPRDLYLDIPSFGYGKINAVHAYGERYDYEGGGPGLMKDTLKNKLDVPIHYFVRMDFKGFEQAINTVGGLDIKVEQPIHDNSYPDENLTGYQPFHLEKGTHHFDGERALKYARSRYSTSDFDRSRRQQKILSAFKQKALSLGTLTNPVTINRLLSNVGEHVKTDLTVDEMMKLIEIARSIDSDDVVQASLTNEADNYLQTRNVGGSYGLVPKTGNFQQIQNYVHSIFVDGYIRQESATVALLNGTKRAGLAQSTQQTLEDYGYQVSKIGNAQTQDYEQTKIYDYSQGDNPYTVRYLEERFNVTAQQRLRNDQDQKQHGSADIVIILGRDYRPEAE